MAAAALRKKSLTQKRLFLLGEMWKKGIGKEGSEEFPSFSRESLPTGERYVCVA